MEQRRGSPRARARSEPHRPVRARNIREEEWLGKMEALRISDAGGALQVGQFLEGLDALGHDVMPSA